MPFPLTFLAEKELACPTLPCAVPGELPYSYIMQSKGWETQAEKRTPIPFDHVTEGTHEHPQGLKPPLYIRGGTAEAVPFPKSINPEHHQDSSR